MQVVKGKTTLSNVRGKLKQQTQSPLTKYKMKNTTKNTTKKASTKSHLDQPLKLGLTSKLQYENLCDGLVKYEAADTLETARALKNKEAIALAFEKCLQGWKNLRQDIKGKDERTRLGRQIYQHLIAKKIAPQRASDVLKRLGIKIGNKSSVKSLKIQSENIDKIFALANELEEANGPRVLALLNRSVNSARKVYPTKQAQVKAAAAAKAEAAKA